MRNIVGAIASEKFSRFIASQLQISQIDFTYMKKGEPFKDGSCYSIDDAESIKAFKWPSIKGPRLLIYNTTVPIVKKNIDIVLLETDTNGLPPSCPFEKYLAIGELKGGIDPAGADEHWKTANTALERVRTAFNNKLPLFFIGAAIEISMANEIFNQYSKGMLSNCANLTDDSQLAALCEWLVQL